MALNLSPDEMARMQALGWGGAPGPAPAPPQGVPAPAPTPPPAALGAPPPPVDFTAGPNDVNAHQPPEARARSKSGVGLDQTVGYAGTQPGAAPPTASPVTPATSSSFSRTVQQGIPMSAETKSLMAEGERKTEQGQTDESAALANAQGVQHRAQIASNALAGQAAWEQQRDAQRTELELAPKRAAVQAAVDDVASSRIDPDNYWHHKGTASKIALALAQAMGRFGASLTHSPNTAAAIVQGAVDRDVDAQHAAIDAKKAGLEGQKSLYSLTAGAFRDRDEQKQAARVTGLAAAQKQIADASAASNDPLERARLEQTQGAVNERQAQERARLDEMVAGKVTTSSHSASSSGGTAAGIGGVPADKVVRGPDGKMYLLNDAKGVQEAQKSMAQAQSLRAAVADVQKLRDAGGQLPVGDTHAKLQAAQARLRGIWMDMHQKRMPPEMLKEQADDAIGSPDSLFDWHADARLKALVQGADATVQSDLQGYGAQPLDPGNIATQGGKVVYQTPSVPVLPTGHKAKK